MADRISQSDLSVLGVGTPNARVSNADLSILGVGTPNARVSGASVGVLYFLHNPLPYLHNAVVMFIG
jgi:hypothetical protein